MENHIRIGINAMSSIDAMRKDFEGTVQQLHVAGCSYIEAMSDWGARKETIDFYSRLTGGPSGWDPENTIRRMAILKKYGMHIEGMFVFDDLLLQQAHELGTYCAKYGISYVVLSFLQYEGLDDIYQKIQLIKDAAAILNQYHVQILLHNHEHDSAQVQDKDGTERSIMDIILRNCSPSELMLEIDTGWLVYANVEPAQYILTHLDRIHVLHLKDIARGFKTMPRDNVSVPCGQGVVDFGNILQEVRNKADLLYVLDQDSSPSGDIISDHAQSIQYLDTISQDF